MLKNALRQPLLAALLLTSSLGATALHAQVQPATNTRPMAVPIVPAVPDAQDVAYPGTIDLKIDASDVTTGAYRVTETIPVAPGTSKLTLLLPEWLPGNHSPDGLIADLAEVRFFAGGKRLP